MRKLATAAGNRLNRAGTAQGLAASTRVLLGALLVGTALGGCKYFPAFDEVLQDKKKEYQKSESLPDLDVPPDLSNEAIKDTMSVPDVDGGTASYSTYQERVAAHHKDHPAEAGAGAGNYAVGGGAAAAAAAGTTTGGAADSNGAKVDVRGTVGEVWPKLKRFWKDKGYALAVDDQQSGHMSTEWLENTARMTRDKFDLHASAGKSGTTELTLQHIAQAQKPDGERLSWVDAPAEGAVSPWLGKLEEAVSGVPVSMVSEEERAAQRAERAREAQPEAATEHTPPEILFAGEGKRYLLISSSFADTWHDIGEALAQKSIEVEDRDESRGVYYVRYYEAPKDKSFWSRLAFWNSTDTDAKHQVTITAVGRKSEVVVLDQKGNWENDSMADHILQAIQNHIKAKL